MPPQRLCENRDGGSQCKPPFSVMRFQVADNRIVGVLVACLAALRFCHTGVLWVEEAYPMAAARAALNGKTLYRDVWFDKPPLFPGFYALFNATMGWPLRLAGALFVGFAAWAAWRAARQ